MKKEPMLFVLMGAAGSGKTALTKHLNKNIPNVQWFDFDDIGVPNDADRKWRNRSSEHWLKKALELQEQGLDMGLFTGSAFGEMLACPSAIKIKGMSSLLLDCNDVVRIERIRNRKADDPWASQDTLCWAAWLRLHAVDPQWRQDVIRTDSEKFMEWRRWEKWKRGDSRWQIKTLDTTNLSIDETSKSLLSWAEEQSELFANNKGSIQGEWWKK